MWLALASSLTANAALATGERKVTVRFRQFLLHHGLSVGDLLTSINQPWLDALDASAAISTFCCRRSRRCVWQSFPPRCAAQGSLLRHWRPSSSMANRAPVRPGHSSRRYWWQLFSLPNFRRSATGQHPWPNNFPSVMLMMLQMAFRTGFFPQPMQMIPCCLTSFLACTGYWVFLLSSKKVVSSWKAPESDFYQSSSQWFSPPSSGTKDQSKDWISEEGVSSAGSTCRTTAFKGCFRPLIELSPWEHLPATLCDLIETNNVMSDSSAMVQSTSVSPCTVYLRAVFHVYNLLCGPRVPCLSSLRLPTANPRSIPGLGRSSQPQYHTSISCSPL